MQEFHDVILQFLAGDGLVLETNDIRFPFDDVGNYFGHEVLVGKYFFAVANKFRVHIYLLFVVFHR